MDVDEPLVMGNPRMEADILNVVSQHPEGIWIEEIARVLHRNRATISKYVGRLEAARKVLMKVEGQMKRVYPNTTARKGQRSA